MSTGDKVVCVDDSPFAADTGEHLSNLHLPNGYLHKGTVYCVAGVRINGSGISLFIVGKPAYRDGRQASWHVRRFRKLSEIKAENTANQRQEATA